MQRRVLAVGIIGCLAALPLAVGAGGEVRGAETLGTLYPSPHGSARLPEGVLVQAASGGEVYVVQGGKKSLIFRPILDRWLKEAHYFKADVIVKLAASELAAYPDANARNTFSMGRYLRAADLPAEDGYFIDDRLRRRPMKRSVFQALKYPSRNVYVVPRAMLDAFPDGPRITRTDIHPGGTVMYHGPYHGGVVYLIRGDKTKHEFLQDYAYETMGFPWSSQILSTTAAELARYTRGAHISTYPDGWIVGVGGNSYLVERGKLRWIASKAVFDALGYNPKYVLTVFPEFFKNYPVGSPVTAFKSARATVTQASADRAASLLGATGGFEGLSEEQQKLLATVNQLFLEVYDRDPSREENKFWVSYISAKKPRTARALQAIMRSARETGELPKLPSAAETTPGLAKVPPAVAKLIRNVNLHFLTVYDRNPTPAENKFWVDFLFKGEAQNERAFLAALKRTKATGRRPPITSRDEELPPERLLAYVELLFYFVFGRFPDGEEKGFWNDRVNSGLRKTITDLGGNMQYLKDLGLTKR